MNNGFRWLSDNEVEIIRDDDIVKEKVEDGINVEKMLLWENIIEIFEKRMFDLEENMISYVGSCCFYDVIIIVNLIIMLVSILLGFIYSNITIFPVLSKISLALLISFGTQKLIGISQIKEIKKEYKASGELKKKYEKELEKTKKVNNNMSNSFYKSTNVISFSEYNKMFYEIVDRQVNVAVEKNKSKKLVLKKNK